MKDMSGGNKLAVFWDNARIHLARRTQRHMRRLRIREVRNCPYSPHTNGIETLWANVKAEFRKEITRKKLKDEPIDAIGMVDQIM